MTTYNTRNPLGSVDVKDLYDNAQNLDVFSNGQDPAYADRFGVSRKSLAGMRQDFSQFLLASGFEYIGDYDSPGELTFTRPNQIMSKGGEYWRPGPGLALPYTTVNNWVIDQPKFVSTGDASLRQALAASGGSALVGYGGGTVKSALDSLQGGQDGVNVKTFGAVGDGIADDTAAIMAAYASLPSGSGRLRFPRGVYNFTKLDFSGAIGLHLQGEGAINTSFLRCISTNAADGLKVQSTFDCTASFLHFDHSLAAFTGWLADLQHNGPSGNDTQGMFFFRCTFASQNYDKFSAKGVNLDQATLVTFLGCKFGGLLRPVDGQNPLGGSYSNGVRFIACQSFENVGYFANFLGKHWSFEDCNFQACHDGAQRIAFSDNATYFKSVRFTNCGIYDALAANSSYLNLGNGQNLSVYEGTWGGRRDLGSSTFLNATGAIIGLIVRNTDLSLFTNGFVAGVPGSAAWDLTGGNDFSSVTTPIVNPQNVAGLSLDLNFPNVSRGTLPSTSGANSVRYNQDSSIEMSGIATGVASGTNVFIPFPIQNFPTACWHVGPVLQNPGGTGNVVSLVGDPTATGFTVYINGSGLSNVRWEARGK